MATQQGAPSRPWFRLATMVPPPPTQQPHQASPPPRPAFIRPAFSQAVPRPPNATPSRVSTPTSAPTVSKAARVSTPTSAPTVSKAARVSTPTSSPPPTISQPPSPLVLPPPQPKYEEKTVITQETKGLDNGRRGSRNPKGNNSSNSDDVGMRIITIAGENKGAIMDLGKKKDNPTPSSGDENKSGSNSEAGKSNARKKNQKLKSPLMRAIMNSNVQGVNNSILFNSSTNHHDPGVHLSFSRKPNSVSK